ncbi:hypothetical protein [Achromobacter xylosoxidans]|uniref:hypothetical protein n=1 Tax=Alcaligenes xylosoxydans xylosoxydans TaxID=85698 RepID=UPI003CFC517F
MREHERVVRENNELNGRNAVLEEQLQTLENRLQEREKWTRFTTKGGGVVLVEKIHTDPTQAGAIYACVYCFEDRKIFPLQPVSARRFLHCPTHGNVNFESDGSMKISAQALEKAGGNLGPHGWMAR